MHCDRFDKCVVSWCCVMSNLPNRLGFCRDQFFSHSFYLICVCLTWSELLWLQMFNYECSEKITLALKRRHQTNRMLKVLQYFPHISLHSPNDMLWAVVLPFFSSFSFRPCLFYFIYFFSSRLFIHPKVVDTAHCTMWQMNMLRLSRSQYFCILLALFIWHTEKIEKRLPRITSRWRFKITKASALCRI